MKADELRAKLRGVIAFPVTPFKPDLSLDIDGLRGNLKALLKHPICAVVAAGGTGELYSLTPEEHLQVVRATVEEAGGRIPVVAGSGYNAPLGAAFARQAREAGADAILALPPYYTNADPEGLAEYYAAIGAATPLPLMVYSRDWVNPSPEWVARLAERVPTLACWKEGQGDVRGYPRIMRRLGDRLHWIGGIGDDCVPGYYSIGIRVYTSSIATVAPKLSVLLHERAAAGDAAGLKELMDAYVTPLFELRTRRKGYEVSVMKEMMDQVGLRGGPCRPPLPNVRPEDKKSVAALLEGWKPVL